MSKYTTELRYILGENEANVSDIHKLIDDIRPALFDFVYPSSNMTAKEKESFEKHFIMHYLYNEIGFETLGAFKNRLQSKLMDVMPMYNELYKTLHLDLNLFDDYSITTITHTDGAQIGETKRTASDSITGQTDTISETQSKNLTSVSDTPQTSVDIYSNDYISNLNKTNASDDGFVTATTKSGGTSNSNDNTSSESTLDSSVKTFGNNGNNADKLEKYRKLILNIELDIIKDCRNLFMLIW